MAFYHLSGSLYNYIPRLATPPVPESASTLFPVANLGDGLPEKPFFFATVGASSFIDIDLQMIPNGDFEAAFVGGLPTARWTKIGTPTITRDTGTVYGLGVGSMKIVAGTNGEGAYFDLVVTAGELFIVGGAAQKSGTATAKIYVRNLDTGKYLDGNGDWQTSLTAFVTGGAGVWSAIDLSASIGMRVESFASTRRDRMTVRVSCVATTGGNAFFDAIQFIPYVNFAAIVGHNIPPVCGTIRIFSDTVSPALFNEIGTFAPASPTMFSTFVLHTSDSRYMRIACDAQPLQVPNMIGELVLAEVNALGRDRENGETFEIVDPQDRTPSENGETEAYIRTQFPHRRRTMNFKVFDENVYATVLEIMSRSRNGAFPLLIVPDSASAPAAMMCRVSQVFSATEEEMVNNGGATVPMRPFSLVFDELPFPRVLP